MDSTQDQPENNRSTERWNSVPIPERVGLRALTNVNKQADGCWISWYSIGSHGYSQIGWQDGGKRHAVLGHKAAWTVANGQVPAGVTLDHTCKTRRCVNPAHLRLLGNFDNARRINGEDWELGQCRNGHEDSNLIPMTRRTKSGEKRSGVTCGICKAESQARYVAAHPERRRASTARHEATAKVTTHPVPPTTERTDQ